MVIHLGNPGFSKKDFAGGRRAAADEVAKIALGIPLASVLKHANSALPGERVGAAIALQTHIGNDPVLAESKVVMDTIKQGLADSHSRVRFRFVDLVRIHPVAGRLLTDKIRQIAINDYNPVVREEASRALAVLSGLDA